MGKNEDILTVSIHAISLNIAGDHIAEYDNYKDLLIMQEKMGRTGKNRIIITERNNRTMLNLGTISYKSEEILAKRIEVAQGVITDSPNIKDPNISRIAPSDLLLLFNIYDQIFLNHQFAKGFCGKLRFSLSSRLSKTAGKTICPKDIARIKPDELTIEIRIGTQFLFRFHEISSTKSVAGITADSSLEALQLVFEHELCHVIEFVNFHTSSCKQPRFKILAHNLFGHTESTHQLPTSKQIAEQKYGFKIGDTVRFSVDNRKYKGILYGINQRATVMVRDKNGTHIDKQGNRYTKYYVPVCLLK